MPDIRSKALGYLRDGKVVVLHARTNSSSRAPIEIVAVVTGFTAVRRVELTGGEWTCTCQGLVSPGRECAHRAAVALATGHGSAAAKPAKPAKRVAA